MAILDPIVDGIASILEVFDNIFDAVTNPEIDGVQATQIVGGAIEEAQPVDEIAASLVDLLEEFILSELQDVGELTPENVEAVADETEGAATAILLGLGIAGSAIEVGTIGQVDKHQEYISQALAGLGIDDVTGTELEARISEGVMPALEAKAGKQHRAKFVDLPDAVEYLLRNKDGDTGWLQGDNIPRAAYQTIQSNEPENPRNALEEWGIRDDQLEILEEVSLASMEFEELIETPAELGLIVDDDILELILDLEGYPEPLKEFLSQIPGEIPRTTRMYEERTAAEELVSQLDTLVLDGELRPGEAQDELPAEVEDAERALLDRWQLLNRLPPGSPTRSQVESSFARGYSGLEDLKDRLERLEYDPEEYPGIWKASVLDELDGDLQEAVALGLLSESAYSNIAQEVGLDDETVELLLQGQSFSDISKQRLQESTDPSRRAVGTIVGIGESRARALDAAGIETVEDLAGAEPGTVADLAGVSPETAEELITRARVRVQQGG